MVLTYLASGYVNQYCWTLSKADRSPTKLIIEIHKRFCKNITSVCCDSATNKFIEFYITHINAVIVDKNLIEIIVLIKNTVGIGKRLIISAGTAL